MSACDRRSFLGTASVGSVVAIACASASRRTMSAEKETQNESHSFCAFTESFEDWSIPRVCEQFKSIGLDGLDLTVRPGGHIEPENARQQLPEAAKAARAVGLEISMLTTAIKDDDELAEAILGTAGQLGIGRVKLGYYRYGAFGQLLAEIEQTRRRIERVAKVARRHGVLPCVHIHSGPIIPSGGPLAYFLLKDFSPDEVGAYADPMHMTLEGGVDGWRQGLDLLAPWIAISSMKNCLWLADGRDEFGQQKWTSRKCPVADGIAPIPQFVELLRATGFRGLVTMHSEYKDDNSWKRLGTAECLEQTAVDLQYVKKLLLG